MQTEVSSDKPIPDDLLSSVVAEVESGLSRHHDRLTRAEVHLTNADRSKGGQPSGCRLEVRPAGREPVSVDDAGGLVDEAVRGAVGKMQRLLASTFSKVDSHRGGPSASGQPT